MTRQTKEEKATRKRHSQQHKNAVLALALGKRVGVTAATKLLDLDESQFYSWRSKARLSRERGEVEQQLAVENARLKQQLLNRPRRWRS